MKQLKFNFEKPIVDLKRSMQERDAAIEDVSEHSGNFMHEGIVAIAGLEPAEYSGEDIRLILTNKGIVPHHNNAWGALILAATRKGLLEHTGRLKKSRIVTSHAKKSFIYYKI